MDGVLKQKLCMAMVKAVYSLALVAFAVTYLWTLAAVVYPLLDVMPEKLFWTTHISEQMFGQTELRSNSKPIEGLLTQNKNSKICNLLLLLESLSYFIVFLLALAIVLDLHITTCIKYLKPKQIQNP